MARPLIQMALDSLDFDANVNLATQPQFVVVDTKNIKYAKLNFGTTEIIINNQEENNPKLDMKRIEFFIYPDEFIVDDISKVKNNEDEPKKNWTKLNKKAYKNKHKL